MGGKIKKEGKKTPNLFQSFLKSMEQSKYFPKFNDCLPRGLIRIGKKITMQNGNAVLGLGLKAGWRVRKSPSLPLREAPVLSWLGHSGGPTLCLPTSAVVMAGKTVLGAGTNGVMVFVVDGKGKGWLKNSSHGSVGCV